MSKAGLDVRDLRVSVDGKPILKGVSLRVAEGEVHALMGPNGSGKSTLASVLMGHPGYRVDGGGIAWNGEDVLSLSPDARAKRGLFLSFQYPLEVPGVSLASFLREAYNEVHGVRLGVPEFRERLLGALRDLNMPEAFADRFVNDGFSGGEKKRAEVLQMRVLGPRLAVLDETDSGLDVDSLRVVAEGVQRTVKETGMGSLLITHYQRILQYVRPDFVHVLVDGKIVRSGGPELADALEKKGYAAVAPLPLKVV